MRHLRASGFVLAIAAMVMAGCSGSDATSRSGSSSTDADPVATAPLPGTEPDTIVPATSEPAVTEAARTEPTDTEPAPTTPAATAPVTTERIAPEDVPAIASAGCGDRTFTLGDTISPVSFAGTAGRALEMLPSAYDGDSPLPLVLDLHGYSSPLEIERLFSNLATTGEAHGFIVELPQIDRDVARWDASIGSNDLEFVVGVVDHVLATRCVDIARVYAAGMSNGAFMTSALACQLSARIAAAAPVAGIRDPDGCTFTRPVPVIAFHGTADSFVAYDGGLGPSVAALPTEEGGTLGTGAVTDAGPSIEEIAAAWSHRNGCEPDPPEISAAADDVDRLVWSCPGGGETELYRVADGGHAWPGSTFSQAVEGTVGRTTMSIDANELIWAFFEAHPLRG